MNFFTLSHNICLTQTEKEVTCVLVLSSGGEGAEVDLWGYSGRTGTAPTALRRHGRVQGLLQQNVRASMTTEMHIRATLKEKVRE